MTEPERPPTLHLVLAWAAVYLIWGSTYLGIRVAIESIPPFLMAGSRHLLAGLLLYAWSRLRQAAPAPSRQDWIRATGLGVLMLVTANGATTWAEQLVPSGLTALIVCTSALWLVLLNWLWLGATRPGARTVAGIVAGFGGVALLVVPGNFGGSRARRPDRRPRPDRRRPQLVRRVDLRHQALPPGASDALRGAADDRRRRRPPRDLDAHR